jgi:hypothetical protein
MCGRDKLHLVNIFTMVGAHLSTLVNPQNALMFSVGKKCMKVGALQQKVSLYEVISLYFE